MNIEDLSVKHTDGPIFEWREPTIDIYDKETMSSILQEIMDNSCEISNSSFEIPNISGDRDEEKRKNK